MQGEAGRVEGLFAELTGANGWEGARGVLLKGVLQFAFKIEKNR